MAKIGTSCKRARIVAAGVAVAIGGVTWALLAHEYSLISQVQAGKDAVAAWVQAHPLLSPAVFLLFATVGTITPFPGAIPIMVTGGFLFGSISGGILSALGVTSSAGLVCLAGRRLFAGPIERALAGRRNGAIAALTSDAFHYLLALRLLPGMPAWLTNLLPVPLPIPLRTILPATSLGILPTCLIFAAIGNGVAMLGAERQPYSVQMMLQPTYLAPLLGLAMLAILPPVIKKMRKSDN